MSCMYAFHVRWAASSWPATVGTDAGNTHPDPSICPLGRIAVPAGKSANTWQSAWLDGLGAWPETRAM